jgi:DNA-binding CsgD family transcriptional regulator
MKYQHSDIKDTSTLDDALRGQPHLRALTTREIAVMEYAIQRYANKEIAAAIGISAASVASHLYTIRSKLQVLGKNRNALIAAYLATREA